MEDKTLIIQAGNTKIVTVDPRAPLQRAINLMKEHDFRHLPVVDEGKVVGLLSDRDLQRATRIHIDDLLSTKVVYETMDAQLIVADVMSWPVRTIEENQPTVDAIDIMMKDKVSSLLITNKDEVVGIVTSHDFLKILKAQMLETDSSLIDELKAQWINSPIKTLVDTLSQSGI